MSPSKYRIGFSKYAMYNHRIRSDRLLVNVKLKIDSQTKLRHDRDEKERCERAMNRGGEHSAVMGMAQNITCCCQRETCRLSKPRGP